MEFLNSISSISRPLDPRYRTNLAIMVLGLVVTITSGLFQISIGSGYLPGIVWGVSAGISCFLGWATAREIDPDYPYSAFVGAGLVVVGLYVFGLPALLFGFWVLVSLRLVNRTCGPPATWLDSLGGLGLTLILVFRDFWLVGLAMTVIFLVDALLAPGNRKQFIFAAISLLGTLFLTVLPSVSPEAALGTATWIVLGVGILLMFLVIGTSREVETVCDYTQDPLESRRVQAAQVLALLVGILMIVVDGGPGLAASLPLWAAILGVGLFRVFALATGAGQGGA